MLTFLKNHPFAVEAFFEHSVVLTFAIPKEELLPFIPKHLTLDTFEDKWAFIAVAVVKTKALRPKGFPKFLGNNFYLIGFRIFVNYKTINGKNLRGLYIIKSETNKKLMEVFGNLFTHYNYNTTDFKHQTFNETITLSSIKSNLKIVFNKSNENVQLPVDSPFVDWKTARRFAGPLPFTFTVDDKKNEVLIIEGVRENWTPKPIEIIEHQIGFLEKLNFKNITLANAFIIENIPYYWKKGKIEKWN